MNRKHAAAAGVSWVLALGLVAACQSTPTPAAESCAPGTKAPCSGAGACTGTQACRSTGLGYGECACGAQDAGDAGAIDAAVEAAPLDASGDATTHADADADAGPPPCSSIRVPSGVDVVGTTFDVLHGGTTGCYEAWAKFQPEATLPAIALSQGGNGVGEGGWLLYCYPNALTADVYTSGGASTVTANVACDDGAFHHVAMCFGGGDFEVYFDGTPLGSAAGVPQNRTLAFHIAAWGSYPDRGTTTVDEVRVSTSRRYTSAFVPHKRLTLDPATKQLFHFDEGAGTSTADTTGGAALTLPSASLWSATCP